MQTTAYTSLAVQDEVKIFLKDMDDKIKAASHWEYRFTIDRVSSRVRELNPEAYTPQYIAIGPLHRHRVNLKPMEQQKLKLVKDFLGEAYEKPTLLAYYFELMRALEEEVRQCYSEDIQLKDDEFTRMMLVDGCFLLQLIHKWRDYTGSSRSTTILDDSGSVSRKDVFFTKTMMQYIIRDLMLVENQLPFFVLKKLSSLNSRYSKPHVIYEETRCFLENFLKPLQTPDDYDETSVVFPYFTVWHLLDYARYLAVSPQYRSEKDFRRTYCATELKKVATVKFEKSQTGSLTEIRFDKKKGVLQIPPIDINDHCTEPLLRNLLALEQSRKFKKKYVTAYVLFMGNLIKSAEDVQLLQQEDRRIFCESQINPEEVVALFKDLPEKVMQIDAHFSHVYNALENRYDWAITHRIVSTTRRYWAAMKTTRSYIDLKATYFATPWSFIGLCAATAILVLTALQTYASFKGIEK